MNEEIKDFLIRNGAKMLGDYLRLDIGNNIDLRFNFNEGVSFWQDSDLIYVGVITLDRLKALIYGLIGKQLE